MKIALIENNVVANIIEATKLTVVYDENFRKAFPFDVAIGVDGAVTVGDTYDSETGFISHDGERVFPPVSEEERLTELEAQVADLETALCDMDSAQEERLTDIENALCELDENGGV